VLCVRPAIANERLKRNRAGQVMLQLKSAFKDGTYFTFKGGWRRHGELRILVLFAFISTGAGVEV